MTQKIRFNQSGAIVRLRLRNFMTYNDVTIKPGPNLNMIIGPNGTGKSAIVCSIIVGLAGDVTLTGRASNITNLVQKGRDWALTEIELFNEDGRNYVIERKITITSRTEGKIDHKSEWKLDGKSVLKRNIEDLISRLSIKVDNLCQFLPQDSVASFVKMNPGELLVNTLKAAGDNQLVEDLDKLVILTNEIAQRTRELEGLKKSSEENEVNARRLETEVQQLQVREKLVRQRTTCQLKIFYARYTEAQEKWQRAEEEFQHMKDELRQLRSSGAPVQEKIESYKRAERDYNEKSKEKLTDSRRVTELASKAADSLERRRMSCQEEYAKFKALQQQQEQRARQLYITQQELDSLVCHLEEIRDVDYSQEIESLRRQAKGVQSDLLAKSAEKRSINDQVRQKLLDEQRESAKLAPLSKDKERRLNFIFERRKDYRPVCEWLAKNKSLFQKDILLPIFCELNIKDLAFADVIENSLNEQDLFSFVCQTEEDLKIFTNHVHDTLNARINVILQPDKTVEEFDRDVPEEDRNRYSQMRFAGFLKDMVEAPEPIMRYLCGSYQFHRIPIFNDLNERELKTMMDTCPKFYSKKIFYSIQKSRYDGTKTTFSEKINDSKLLRENRSTRKQVEELKKIIESIGREKESLQLRLSVMDQESDALNRQFGGINQRCLELANKQNERERIKKQIESLKKKLSDLKNDNVDIEAEQTKLQDTIKKLDHKSIEDLEKLEKIYDTYAIIRKEQILYTMLAKVSNRNHRSAEIKFRETIEKQKTLERTIDEFNKKISDLKAQVSKSKLEAEDKINGFKNGKLDKPTKHKFDTIEYETAESLQLYLEELKARIQGMQGVVGNDLLDEFRRQERELKDKRIQIAGLESSIEEKAQEQSTIKSRFLDKLGDVIKVIDEHYQSFMRKLNYDGKVELNNDPANQDDFSKYGINIMVKYRENEQLIPLSSTRQSGGERSVATMIYMLALQTKTSVPFRVVDEINQGMDKDNERKVFELLVRTADESSSQYFLVSPKLLSGLSYSDQMHVHVVFNGPHLKYNFNDLKIKDMVATC